MDYLRRKIIHKKLVEASKKISFCSKCGNFNGVVKKAVGAVLKIVHAEPITQENMSNFEEAKTGHKELGSLIPSAKFNLLDPIKVLNIFRRIKEKVDFFRLK